MTLTFGIGAGLVCLGMIIGLILGVVLSIIIILKAAYGDLRVYQESSSSKDFGKQS